jgi:predicted nucleotidyltransferase
MRLSKNEVDLFLITIKEYDQNAQAYLFGSRAHDNQLGGDIDILIHSQKIDKPSLRKIKWQLIEKLGEQKIDLLLSKDLSEPFVRLILPEAIKLGG